MAPATCQQLSWHCSAKIDLLALQPASASSSTSEHGDATSDNNLTWQAAQEARLPEPEADLPAFAYGPGGSVSGAFGGWASAHQSWLGQQHLEALMKLTGNVSICVCVCV